MLLNSVAKLVLISFQCLAVVLGSIHENVIDTGCHHDGDCEEFVQINQVSNSTCSNHQCVCRDSDFKIIACYPEKQGLANVIGGKCPCANIRGSSCMDELCKCKPDYTPSWDKRSCIPTKVPIGSRCEHNAQCFNETAFSTCSSNNTCSCDSGFILHNGTCQRLVAKRPPVEETASFLQSLLSSHGPNYLEKLFGGKARDALEPLGGVEKVAIALSESQTIEDFGAALHLMSYRGCKIHLHYSQRTDVSCHHEEIDIHRIFVMYSQKTLEITDVWPITFCDDRRNTWRCRVDQVQPNFIPWSRSQDSYCFNSTWKVDSCPPLQEVRLLYRKLMMNETFQQPAFTLKALLPGSVYEAIVQAKNRYGWNEVISSNFKSNEVHTNHDSKKWNRLPAQHLETVHHH